MPGLMVIVGVAGSDPGTENMPFGELAPMLRVWAGLVGDIDELTGNGCMCCCC